MTEKNNDPDTNTLRQSKEIDPALKATTSTSEWGPPPNIARLSASERIAAEKKLKRKIDIRLLPTLVVMYILSRPLLFLSDLQIILIVMRLRQLDLAESPKISVS